MGTRLAVASASMSLRVHLRDVRDNDLVTLFEHQTDPEANRMANFEARDRDAFMAHRAKILRDDSVVVRTIEVESRVAAHNTGSIRVSRDAVSNGPATDASRSTPTRFKSC